MLSTLFYAAFAATNAAAMLVPAEMADKAAGISDDLTISIIDPTHQVLSLQCPGCPIADKAGDDTIVWTFGVENELVLDFKVEGDKIKLNGDGQFLPVESPDHSHRLIAPQVVSGNVYDVVPLGYALEVRSTKAGDKDELWTAQFSIVDLAGMPVTVDTVVVTAIKDTEHGLMIAKIDTIPAEHPTDLTGANCKTGLCRLRAALYARLQAIFDAARAKASKVGASIFRGCAKGKSEDDSARHSGRPNHHHHAEGNEGHPHYHNRHHRHHHAWVRAIAHFMFVLVMPAALGIIGGLLTSVIGMLVGQVIVFVWVKFARGGQRGDAYTRLEERFDADDSEIDDDSDDEEPLDDEKARLIAADKIAVIYPDHTEEIAVPPPMYEDAPKYEETSKE